MIARNCRILVLSISSLLTSHGAFVLGQPIQTAVYGGHTYHLLPQATWTSSEAMAVALGGHLATIGTEAENAFVFSAFTGNGFINRGLWIGLSDAGIEGSFQWSSGAPTGFTRWASGQPDNAGNEDYVHIFPPTYAGSPGWNDYPDLASWGAAPMHGVAEISVLPASAVAAGSGCPGSIGLAPTLGTAQIPSLGNPSFAVTVTQGVAGNTAFLFAALTLAPVPIPIGGLCNLYLDPSSLALFLSLGLGPIPGPIGSGGTATFPIPIPSSWAPGTSLSLQAALTDPPNWPFGFSVTNALVLTVN